MFETLKNRIKHFKSNEQGAMAIIFVIVMFIIVIFVSGYVDNMRTTLISTEVQGIMDLAGVAALREGLDEEAMLEKPDEFIYNEGVIKGKFTELLNKQLKTNERGPIIDYEVMSLDVIYLEDSKWGLGEASRSRNQLVLEAMVTVVLPISNDIFDSGSGDSYEFYDQLNDTTFEVVATNKINDSRTQIVLRSVTRLVR